MYGLKLYPAAVQGMRILNRLELTCTVCGRDHHGAQRKAVDAEAALFGAKQYAVCPCCGGETLKENWTLGYKQRWTRYLTRARAPWRKK